MSEQRTERPVIPKQPECNIGTSGHVDSGKCLALDEYVLIDGRLATGRELLDSLPKGGGTVRTRDGSELHTIQKNSVISLNERLEAVSSNSFLYLQRYKGTIYEIRTRSGRAISVTPEHPLLTNRDGLLSWVRARDLRSSDFVTFVTTVPQAGSASFTDVLTEMKEDYEIVEFTDFLRVSEVTNGFTSFATTDPAEVNQLRLLAGLSVFRLSKIVHMDSVTLGAILRGRRIPKQGQLERLRSVLSSRRFTRLQPDEFLAATKKRGRWSIIKLKDAEMDEELAKWFAFVWAEGTSTAHRLSIAQSIQMKMLREFLSISRRKLGVEFKQTSDVDYQVNSKAMVDFLRLKFGYRPGNESVCGIADWVLCIPSLLRRAFLRWFFTLDGEFDKRGAVVLAQANHRNVVTLGYLLQMFGITPRFSQIKRETKKGVRTYLRLAISGRSNLTLFRDIIGFHDKKRQGRLARYLREIKKESKETDFSIPVSVALLEKMLLSSCLIREGFSRAGLPVIKASSWYKAYEGARRTGRISRSKLLTLLEAVEQQIVRLTASVPLGSSRVELLGQMGLVRVSERRLASSIGIGRKKLRRLFRLGDSKTLDSVRVVLERVTKDDIGESRRLFEQFARLAKSPLNFDRVKTIVTRAYDDFIFDLSVPGYANFIAGRGGIVAHNTSIVQAITGVWASAHSEELRRGITIKVGYADAAFYKCQYTPVPAAYSTSPTCPVCGKPTDLLRAVSFVDAPGHESLMTNMLAGAFLMDGALLVIASNEPVPRPQTREHLQALQMLGMKKIVVVQNKIDLVTDEEARKNYDAIQNFVAKTVAGDAPIIPISAQQRINIDALIEAIEEVIPTPKRDPAASALMYVVRSFDVNKPGIDISQLTGGVLGGSLVRGKMEVGDDVEILPGIADERGKFAPVTTRVTSLGTGAGITRKVGPGGLVAVGTELDPAGTKGDQMVGSVVGKPGALPPVWEHITLELQLFDSAVGSAEMVKVERVRAGESLRLNVGTASTLASVTSARDSVAEMDLKKPVSVEEGARASVSRRIAERWRLIGSGVLK